MGHLGTNRKPKSNGRLGSKVGSNKGVFQGSPLSAYLFIIYDESTMGGYGDNLKQETIQSMQTIKLEMAKKKKKRSSYLHLKKI